ncbi:MAG: hypothetical protein ABW133_19990 [Polyangiaceae bacterium]
MTMAGDERLATEYATSPRAWTSWERVLFRFVFVYFVVYFFPLPEGFFPGIDVLGDIWGRIFLRGTPWICKAIFGVACQQPEGAYANGDNAGDYAALFFVAATTVVITVIWSIADRRARSYPRLYELFRVYVRFSLAFLMLMYGVVKLMKGQFGFPRLEEIARPLGELTPMGLMWTFMGYSTPYTFFGGLLETTSGLLLYFRRTTLLGACIAAGVMTNVVVMNFSYQVFVRLFSTHILLLAIVLLAPDGKRLFEFFVRSRATAPARDPSFIAPRWKKPALGLKVLLMAWAIGLSTYRAVDQIRQFGDNLPKHALYGIYDVESFALAGEALPPLLTDRRRWRRMIVEQDGRGGVWSMDDARRPIDCAKSSGSCILSAKSAESAFTYERADGDRLVLSGKLGEEDVAIRLKKLDLATLPILAPFHLIER